MSDADTQAAITILQKYDKQFTEIIDLTSSKPILTGAEKERAKELLRKLKADLKNDTKELYRREQRKELNTIERTCLEPALRKAEANIATAVNTTPDKRWSTDLYGARIDITWMLHALQNPKS